MTPSSCVQLFSEYTYIYSTSIWMCFRPLSWTQLKPVIEISRFLTKGNLHVNKQLPNKSCMQGKGYFCLPKQNECK